MKEFTFRTAVHKNRAGTSAYNRYPAWIVIYASTLSTSRQNRYAWLPVLAERRNRIAAGDTDTDPFVAELPNETGSHIACVCLETDMDNFNLLTIARKLVAIHTKRNSGEVAVTIAGFGLRMEQKIAAALAAAAAAAAAKLPAFKSVDRKRTTLTCLHYFGLKQTPDFKQVIAEAEGNTLARSLSVLPGNKLTPAIYLKEARKLARTHGWKLDFYGIPELKRRKAGAFLAVCQGSEEADAGIVRLRYQAPVKRCRTLALVGKGICYDTGGTNLKPANYMYGMHHDMQGSAVALGILLALTRLRARFNIECWLALANNHIGPRAYKPNDLVTACDGTTIEVVHTDAEGRMVLADTLAMVSALQPDLIMDYATLTGACTSALGTGYSGVFSNRDKLYQLLIKSGKDCGERVWPFPLDADFDQGLESSSADIKQCAQDGKADHILAARFLQRFISKDIPWIHMDLAASRNKGGLAHIPTDTTGFGVRYTLNLLLQEKVLNRIR